MLAVFERLQTKINVPIRCSAKNIRNMNTIYYPFSICNSPESEKIRNKWNESYCDINAVILYLDRFLPLSLR